MSEEFRLAVQFCQTQINKMFDLHCFGTNFRIVGSSNLEKIVCNSRELRQLYDCLQKNNIENVVILSTCNRFEIYWSGGLDLKGKLIELLGAFKKELPQYTDNFYFKDGYEAFKHLFLVTMGFDSMLSAEDDIFVQVKIAYSLSDSVLKLNKSIHLAFQNALRYSRFFKNRYDFSKFKFMLVDYIKKILTKIFTKIDSKHVLIIGTGYIAKSIINKLHNVVKTITVYSHNEERLNNLIVEVNKKIDKMTKITDLSNFDIIIGAISTTECVIGKEYLKSIRKEMIALFDLGIPRNFSPDIADLNNIFLFTLDDIYNFHESIFKEKIEEFQELKNNIESEIQSIWTRLEIDSENIDWINLKESIKQEIMKNLKYDSNNLLDDHIVNKLTHNIIKNLKNYFIKTRLLDVTQHDRWQSDLPT